MTVSSENTQNTQKPSWSGTQGRTAEWAVISHYGATDVCSTAWSPTLMTTEYCTAGCHQSASSPSQLSTAEQAVISQHAVPHNWVPHSRLLSVSKQSLTTQYRTAGCYQSACSPTLMHKSVLQRRLSSVSMRQLMSTLQLCSFGWVCRFHGLALLTVQPVIHISPSNFYLRCQLLPCCLYGFQLPVPVTFSCLLC